MNSRCDYSKVMNEAACEDYLLNNMERLIAEQEVAIRNVHEPKQAVKTVNINEYRKELDRLNNMYQKGRIAEDKYDSEYERITNIIKDYENSIVSFPTSQKSFDKIKNTLSGNWIEIYQSLDRENKRAFWREIIESIECNTDTGTIKRVNSMI